MLNNTDLLFNYDDLTPFPVRSGDLGLEFDLLEAFGYFIHMSDGSVVQVEGMMDVNKHLNDDVEKVVRRFFWNHDGTYNEEVILERNADNELVKTIKCDSSRIFMFDMTYLYSVNAEYIGTYRGGKRLSNQARDQKVDIVNQTVLGELDGWISSIRRIANVDRPCIALEMVSEFDHQFNRRDVSNMIKIPEDAISEVLDINDAYNYFVSNRKVRGLDNNEKLYIKVNLVNYWW